MEGNLPQDQNVPPTEQQLPPAYNNIPIYAPSSPSRTEHIVGYQSSCYTTDNRITRLFERSWGTIKGPSLKFFSFDLCIYNHEIRGEGFCRIKFFVQPESETFDKEIMVGGTKITIKDGNRGIVTHAEYKSCGFSTAGKSTYCIGGRHEERPGAMNGYGYGNFSVSKQPQDRLSAVIGFSLILRPHGDARWREKVGWGKRSGQAHILLPGAKVWDASSKSSSRGVLLLYVNSDKHEVAPCKTLVETEDSEERQFVDAELHTITQTLTDMFADPDPYVAHTELHDAEPEDPDARCLVQ